MALVSPGVEVTIVDESNYLPAATNSVPYILLATAQDKISGTGTGIAAGTLAANAGKVYLITSQRELSATFGNPFFYKTSAGTPINGYELNEYGLLAAYSALGISNRAYIQRANVDLSQLTASLVRPTGDPDNGTYWLDLASTLWGIFEWNQSTGQFTVQEPLVINDSDNVTAGVPNVDIGQIGDYAVVTTTVENRVYYKNDSNTWVLVGSDAWKTSWPTIIGANSVTGATLTPAQTIIINGTSVAVPGAGTVQSLSAAINTAAITGITSGTASGKLQIFADSSATADGSSGDLGIVNIDPLSSAALLTALGITAGTYATPALQQSFNYQVPRWRTTDTTPRPSGSIWNKTSNVNNGAKIVVKKWDSNLASWITQSTPIYGDGAEANYGLDPTGAGLNIPVGTLYVEENVAPEIVAAGDNNTFTLEPLYRWQTGATIVAGSNTAPSFTPGDEFTIRSSVNTSGGYTILYTVTLSGSTAADFVADVLGEGITGVSAQVNSNGSISLINTFGGDLIVEDTTGTPLADAGFTIAVEGIRDGKIPNQLIVSNWKILDYTASSSAIDQDPNEGTYWYYSAVDQVDIMVLNNGNWAGYRTVSNDVRGYNLSLTDPAGPIVSASEPFTQSDGTALVYGDIWIDTSNLELYPVIKRWQNNDGVNQWVTIDNSDQTTENGILFADARWAANGTTNPITDNIPTITSLLSSSYLDLDAPDTAFYPEGLLLFNTRRSGYNVKSFQVDYFNAVDFNVDAYSGATAYVAGDKVLYNGTIYVAKTSTTGNLPTNTTYWSLLQTNAWVTASGNKADGSPYMGRFAQRQIVVAALKAAIDTQDTLREEQNVFNLIACPQYPELIPNMIALNNERSGTGFVIGDTPLRLAPTALGISTWATDASGTGYASGDGLSTSSPYAGVFYPSCQTNDLSGSLVVQPPSHMMIRTIIRNDEVAFPWLAPAGVRRGLIDNAARLGYINAATGDFVTIATGQGIRDTLYENRINPLTFIPGVGLTNYGNKTIAATASALDRINVARLVGFVRGRLSEIAKTFVFEPNDQITRNSITAAIDGLMIDLVAKRGIYDYLVVCDESNNTPARIDRNELYVDIAIEPVKAVEFIYIPVRIKNTGEIASGNIPPSTTI